MRLIGIDVLRGIAVILVLFRHFDFIDILGKIGWAGVDLFFVLSGFLVSGLLFKEYKEFQDIRPGLFLIRRGFKIYPLFYLLLAFTCLKAGLVVYFDLEGNKNFSFQTLLAEFFFVQNYFDRIWTHTWSLAVEEHFYIFLTIYIGVLVWFKKIGNKILFTSIALSIFIFCLGMRLYNALTSEITFDTHIFPSHLRFDTLFFGVFLSYQYYFNRSKTESFFKGNKWPLRGLAVLLLIPLLIWQLDTFLMSTIGLTMVYLGFGILVMDVFMNESRFHIKSVVLARIIWFVSFVGFFSYSIYLWHIPVKIYLMPLVNRGIGPVLPNSLSFIIYLIFCVAIGFVFSRLLELPMLAYRERYFNKRRE